MRLLILAVVRTLEAREVVDLSRSTEGYLAYAVGLHDHQNSLRKILHGISLGWPLPAKRAPLQPKLRPTAHRQVSLC